MRWLKAVEVDVGTASASSFQLRELTRSRYSAIRPSKNQLIGGFPVKRSRRYGMLGYRCVNRSPVPSTQIIENASLSPKGQSMEGSAWRGLIDNSEQSHRRT